MSQRKRQPRAEVTVPLDVDLAVALDRQLADAEAAARGVLTEHAPQIAAQIDTLTADQRAAAQGAITLLGQAAIAHNEPGRNRRCERCGPARRLLVELGQIRGALAAGLPELAVQRAFVAGAIQLRLGLVQVEDLADFGRAMGSGRKLPRHDRLKQELKALLDKDPTLTAEGLLTQWRDDFVRPDWVQEIEEDGTLCWLAGPGDERVTSTKALEKRLRRMQPARPHK